MKKTITLFVFASLFGSAAPRLDPTFSLDSCAILLSGACDAAGSYTFSGDNYSPHKDYMIFATVDGVATYPIPVSVDANGHMSAEGFAVHGAGTWTFTIYNVSHNLTPQKEYGSDTATFEYAPQ